MSIKRGQYPPLDDEKRTQIIELAKQGLSPRQIRAQFPPKTIGTQQISGFLTTSAIARAAGVKKTRDPERMPVEMKPTTLPPSTIPPQLTEAPTMTTPAAAPMPLPLVTHPTGSPTDIPWTVQPLSVSATGGVAYNASEVRIDVERIVPADGMLGRHAGLTKDELGRLYGEGTYQLVRYEPGKLPQSATIIISENYGPRRFPRREGGHERSSGHEGTPNYAAMGNMARQQMPVQPPQPVPQQEAPSQVIRATMDAAQQMANMKGGQDQGLTVLVQKLIESVMASKDQPIESVKTIFANVDERREREKKEDLDRWARERQTAEERWQKMVELDRERSQKAIEFERERSQRAEEDRVRAHDRELARIKVEFEHRMKMEEEARKSLLAIEDRKLANLVEHHKNEMKLLDKQMEENRKSVEAAHEQIGEERDKDREHDKELWDLKKRELDIAQKHNDEMFDLTKKSADAASSASIEQLLMGTIKDVVTKVDQRLASHDRLKEIEIITQEAAKRGMTVEQYVASMPGNIAPGTAVRMQEPGEIQRARLAAAGQTLPAGRASSPDSEGSMGMVEKYLSTPEFKEIVAEWAGQVELGRGPVSFANTFLTWMAAEHMPEIKTAAATFQWLMDRRDWPKMFATLKPHLSQEEAKAFSSEGAEPFYEGLRSIVHETLQEHYEQFMARRAALAKGREETAKPEAVEVPATVGQGSETSEGEA